MIMMITMMIKMMIMIMIIMIIIVIKSAGLRPGWHQSALDYHMKARWPLHQEGDPRPPSSVVEVVLVMMMMISRLIMVSTFTMCSTTHHIVQNPNV